MAGQSLSTADVLTKHIYGDINEQINSETPALNSIKSTSKNIVKVGGKGILFDAHVGRNDGIGARDEDEDLPEPGRQRYVQGTTGLKYNYGAIELTNQAMKLADKDYQAFASALDEEVTRVKTDLAKDQNRQVFGDGYGTVATVTVAGTSTATIDVDDTKYVRNWKNMGVDVVDGATLGNANPSYRNGAAYVEVIGYDRSTNQITLSQAVTVQPGDILIRSNRTASGGANSYAKEWTGFSALIGDNELHGIDPSTEPEWQSVVRDISQGSTPQAITENDLLDLVIDVRENGDNPTAFFASPRLIKSYWSTLEGRRQYVNKTKLAGGYEVPTFLSPYGEIPFRADFDAPAGTLFAVNEKAINMNSAVGWEFIDEDGSMWKMVPRRDKFIAYLRNYSELSTYRRNTHGKITGVDESS